MTSKPSACGTAPPAVEIVDGGTKEKLRALVCGRRLASFRLNLIWFAAEGLLVCGINNLLPHLNKVSFSREEGFFPSPSSRLSQDSIATSPTTYSVGAMGVDANDRGTAARVGGRPRKKTRPRCARCGGAFVPEEGEYARRLAVESLSSSSWMPARARSTARAVARAAARRTSRRSFHVHDHDT